jgi:hypothetical protein
MSSSQLADMPARCLDSWLAEHHASVLDCRQACMPVSKADSELSCQLEIVLASKPAIVLSVGA